MRKLKEVLRLRFDLGLRQNQIARSCSIGQATVHHYLEKAVAAGVIWPLPDELDDRRLEERFLPAAAGRPSKIARALPDFAEVRRQMQAHKHLTLQTGLGGIAGTQPDSYGYSRFCELFFPSESLPLGFAPGGWSSAVCESKRASKQHSSGVQDLIDPFSKGEQTSREHTQKGG